MSVTAMVPLASLGLVLVSVTLLWALSIMLRDVSIIDRVFALILLGVAVLAAALGVSPGWVRWSLAGLVGVWAVRLTVHLLARSRGQGEDPRYSKLREWRDEGWPFHRFVYRQVFLLQGMTLWLVSLPLQLAATVDRPVLPLWINVTGVGVALAGVLIEAIADLQLQRFRRDPSNHGRVLDEGLWRYSRHPNYFGELTFWWGLFVAALIHPLVLAAVVGPLAYSLLVIRVTGKATLEKRLRRRREGYDQYVERTGAIIPRRPRTSSVASVADTRGRS